MGATRIRCAACKRWPPVVERTDENEGLESRVAVAGLGEVPAGCQVSDSLVLPALMTGDGALAGCRLGRSFRGGWSASAHIFAAWIDLMSRRPAEHLFAAPCRHLTKRVATNERGEVVLVLPLADDCIRVRVVHSPVQEA